MDLYFSDVFDVAETTLVRALIPDFLIWGRLRIGHGDDRPPRFRRKI